MRKTFAVRDFADLFLLLAGETLDIELHAQ